MEKIIKNITVIVFMLATLGCSEDFLERKNLYEQNDENYYANEAQIGEALAGAYASLPLDEGRNNPILLAELLSDERFGGGGVNDDGFHGTDAFEVAEPNYYMNLLQTTYEGILRVNSIISKFDQAEYENESNRDRDLGEAHFLRAYFYFRLAKFFGQVPLKTKPEPGVLPKASPEELFGQIATDLTRAIELMPSTTFQQMSVERLGHATKWAAEGLMARVFLFYTGYYEKSSLPLADGGSVSKDQVIAWVDDCVENSGHGLLDDFRNNWTYSYANEDYPYAADNNLEWAGEEGGNHETVFAIKYSPYGGWNAPNKLSYSNQLVLYSGLREQSYIPFGQGWGAGPVNPQLWDSFEEGDIRREGSILNVNEANPEEGDVIDDYVWGADNQMHETGLWQKKYMPTYVNGEEDELVSMYTVMYGTPTNFQLWNMHDEVLIRFADILLMGAELGGPNAQDYLDRVRDRVDLDPVDATLENIKRERRHELAFEGIRYFDLLRWHDAEEAFEEANNIPVLNQGQEATYTVNYRPETGGFLPIPESQIDITDGVWEQTPGW